MECSAADFTARYIGHPYEFTGLHCWELTRRCQAEVFGRDLPAVLEHPRSKIAVARLMARRSRYAGWTCSAVPEHGAVVFMTRRGHGPERAAVHCGVYLALDGGGVLHTDDPHGVAFESLAELATRNWAGLSFHLPD